MNRKKLLVASGPRKELQLLRRYLPPECRFGSVGLGPHRSRKGLQRLIEAESPRIILLAGTAGQLSPDKPMGLIVIPREWENPSGQACLCDPGLVRRLQTLGWRISGKGVTRERPVLRASARSALFEETGALVCDMESSTVLQVAQDAGIPALSVKVVSDTAESGVKGYWRCLEENIERLASTVTRLITDLQDFDS